MKKSAVLVLVLAVVLLVCLTGCNTNFKFEELKFSNENVTEISVDYADSGKKSTTQVKKIKNILNELNKLDIEKCKEKIADNIFSDSIIGQITFNFADQQGSFVMTFVETNVNGAKVSLLKCDVTKGVKIKNMPKDIYQLDSVNTTNALLHKIFASYI